MFSQKNTLLLTLIFSLFLALNCAVSQDIPKEIDPNSIEGEWTREGIENGHKDKYIFTFAKDKSGKIIGYADSYRDSFKYPRQKFFDIVYKEPEIEFNSNPEANIMYKGTFDLEKQILTGKLYFSDGTTMDFNFKRTGATRSANPDDYVYNKPEDTGDGLSTADITSVNMDKERLIKAVKSTMDGKYGELNSLLVLKGGELVLEEYFNGYKKDDLIGLQSVTKSITSILTGIAIDQKLIEDTGVKVIDYFPEYADVFSPEWEKITLQHFLSMSAGLKWTQEEQDKNLEENDFILDVLEKEPVHEPGTKFDYINANLAVFPGIIKKAAGIHADEFAVKYLFDPLGISDFDWEHKRQSGYPLCSGSLCLRPRDMAKIGLLMLNEGKWNNKQVISSEWIRKSTTKQVENEDYGYLWWLVSRKIDGNEVKGYFANGWGSQFIIVVPGFELVMVTTGNNMSNGKHMAPFQMLTQYILKAVR